MKAQSSMEFLMMVVGIILFVSLVFLLVNGTLLPQAEGQIIDQSEILASLKAGLFATPSPSPTP
ncbi:MAG: hypothetical protein WC607_01510 [Candidatus Micrarchaeia archaeon]